MVPVNDDQSIALVGQSEHSSRLVPRGRPRSVSHADVGRDLDQLGIASREAIFADTNIVLQAGAYRSSATGEDPLDDRVFVTPYPKPWSTSSWGARV
jgi:hypothetical protein